MQLSRPRKRTAFAGLTPLIDMIFLLLLFFLLGSDFARFGQTPLAPPRGSGGATGQAPPAIITLAADGGLGWNGQASDRAALERAVRGRVRADATTLFVVMPAATASIQLVAETLDIVTRAGARQVTLERDVFDIDLADF